MSRAAFTARAGKPHRRIWRAGGAFRWALIYLGHQVAGGSARSYKAAAGACHCAARSA